MKMKKFDPDMESVRRLVIKSRENAEKILSDVPQEKAFWVNNGTIIKNIKELPKAIEEMSDEVFNYHVNKEKNDFIKWIDEVIQDEELARSLKKVKDKKRIVRRIKGRLEYLEKIRKEK